MSDGIRLEQCWKGLDRLLLLLVFVLLAISCWESYRSSADRQPSVEPSVNRTRPFETPQGIPPTAGRVVDGTPVSLVGSRFRNIARTMADSEWESLPPSPAADMREQNGFYDILFTLPDRMDPGSVKVSTSGNVLTLFVSSAGTPAATFVKQFYIPCGAARPDAVETSVSNDIVRVRIRQPGR